MKGARYRARWAPAQVQRMEGDMDVGHPRRCYERVRHGRQATNVFPQARKGRGATPPSDCRPRRFPAAGRRYAKSWQLPLTRLMAIKVMPYTVAAAHNDAKGVEVRCWLSLTDPVESSSFLWMGIKRVTLRVRV